MVHRAITVKSLCAHVYSACIAMADPVVVPTHVRVTEAKLCAGLPGSEAGEAFDDLFRTVIAPVIDVCERSADTLPTTDIAAADSTPADGDGDGGGAPLARLPPAARRIYLINCLLALWSPLSLHKAGAQQAAALKQRIDAEVRAWASGCQSCLCCLPCPAGPAARHSSADRRAPSVQVEGVASSDATRLLSQCGLRAIRDTVAAHCAAAADGGARPPLAADDGLSSDGVVAAMQDLFQLASAADAIPDYEQIMMPRLRVAVGRSVARQLVQAYELVFDAVRDPDNGFNVADGVIKPPALVATLLGVQEQ